MKLVSRCLLTVSALQGCNYCHCMQFAIYSITFNLRYPDLTLVVSNSPGLDEKVFKKNTVQPATDLLQVSFELHSDLSHLGIHWMFVSRVKNNTEDCWRGTVNKGRGGSNKAYLLHVDIILSVKGAGD